MEIKHKTVEKISEEELQSYLNTNKETGLTEQEVLVRREKFGKNVLVKGKRQSFFISFIKAIFLEPMSLLLFVTGMIGLGLAIYENIEKTDTYILAYIEAAVLLSIDVINALFGTIQERRSSNAIDELEKMSSPTTKVLREGKIKQIPSSEVVIGDIIIVEAGDAVSADAILFLDSHLKISEAVLTGESEEVLKDADYKPAPDAPLGDQRNKIFSGTNVLNGKGYAIVCAIGNNTEIGKIADLLNNSEQLLSPLQLKLQKLGKTLGIFGIILTIITFIFTLLIVNDVIHASDKVQSIQESLLLTISLAAISLPEGLAAIVTIVLSVGVKRMTKSHALIKKLPSVETLGSTSVICSDKTGTLTMNKMTVVKTWINGTNNEAVDDIKSNETKRDMIIKASLCSDAVIDENQNESQRKAAIGDSTEVAILELAFKNGISILNINNQYRRIAEIPFDSDRKLMSTINIIDGKQMLIVKGAPDVVFSRCKNFNPEQARVINNAWSDKAIRVLAIAQKEIKGEVGDDLQPADYEFDLQFIGLIGMIDPPREEVKLSIQECISAGIKPVMITGDHLNTAKAIAKDLGIITDEERQLAITGSDLDKMSDEEFYKNIEKYSVYARVSPENKIRIVQAWQSKDQVVAMTGDGVNDAPALKAADIGCAMGITGTDVSKQASDMILMDDNFSTIVQAVRLGRNIYENIRRITKYLLSSNVTGIFAIIFGMIVFYLIFEVGGWGKVTSGQIMNVNTGISLEVAQRLANKLNDNVRFTTTITTILILVHHMVIETFPGVALGAQLTESNLMNRRPISKYESIFARGLISQTIIYGLTHGILTVVAFVIGAQVAISIGAPLLKFYYGVIATFLTLAVGGILKSISMSSTSYVWQQKWRDCKWIYITSLVSFVLVLIMLIPQITAVAAERPEVIFKNYTIEGLDENAFNSIIKSLSGNTSFNDWAHWSIYITGFGLGISTFIIFEMLKYCESNFSKYSKESKTKILDFKLIEKPKPFSWKRA